MLPQYGEQTSVAQFCKSAHMRENRRDISLTSCDPSHIAKRVAFPLILSLPHCHGTACKRGEMGGMIQEKNIVSGINAYWLKMFSII